MRFSVFKFSHWRVNVETPVFCDTSNIFFKMKKLKNKNSFFISVCFAYVYNSLLPAYGVVSWQDQREIEDAKIVPSSFAHVYTSRYNM
jgi:hypothetical protein